MGESRETATDVPITDADMRRFHRLAPVVLGRAGPAYFREEFGRTFSLLLVGGIPLFGLVFMDWSAVEWLLFLLASAWVGILCDAAKVYLLRSQIQRAGDVALEDNFVWTIVDSVRAGKRVAPRDHLRAKYQPGLGVFVDFVFGGFGTLIVVMLLPYSPGDVFGTNRALRVSLLGFLGYRVLFTAWEILVHRGESADGGRVKAIPGLRGTGLFLLAFLVVALYGDESEASTVGESGAWWVMLVVNSLAIVFAILNAWGVRMVQDNARWLRRYVESKAAGVV